MWSGRHTCVLTDTVQMRSMRVLGMPLVNKGTGKNYNGRSNDLHNHCNTDKRAK